MEGLLAQASVGELLLPKDEIYSVTEYSCLRSSILKSKYVFPEETHQDVTIVEHSMEAKKLSILIIKYSFRTS